MCHLVVVNPSKSYLRAYGIMVKHLTPDQRIRVRFLMRLFRGGIIRRGSGADCKSAVIATRVVRLHLPPSKSCKLVFVQEVYFLW